MGRGCKNSTAARSEGLCLARDTGRGGPAVATKANCASGVGYGSLEKGRAEQSWTRHDGMFFVGLFGRIEDSILG